MESDKRQDKRSNWLGGNMVLVIMVNPLSVVATLMVVTGILFGWRYGGLLPMRSHPKLSLGSVALSQQRE